MVQCTECEYFQQDEQGRRVFRCDPFRNIKEPECLMKWQLLRLDLLLQQNHATMAWQQKMSPIQDKIFKYMQREINDIEESDSWKLDQDDDDTSFA